MKLKLLALGALVAALALVGCATANLAPETKLVQVPKVTDMTQEAAANVLKKAGLKVGVITTAPYPSTAQPYVVTQDPPAAAPVPRGTKVNLLVAKPATSTTSPTSTSTVPGFSSTSGTGTASGT